MEPIGREINTVGITKRWLLGRTQGIQNRSDTSLQVKSQNGPGFRVEGFRFRLAA